MSINASFIKPKWCICLFERLFYMKWWVGEKKKKNERLDRPVKIIICRPRVFCCRLLAGHHHSVVDLSCLYRVPTRPEKPWKPGILSFTFWGMQNDWNFLKKWETSGILTQTLKKIISKFGVSKFNWQDVINLQKEKKSLSYLHYQHKDYDSKPNWPGISLYLPGNNLENTWNCVSPEKWEPCFMMEGGNCCHFVLTYTNVSLVLFFTFFAFCADHPGNCVSACRSPLSVQGTILQLVIYPGHKSLAEYTSCIIPKIAFEDRNACRKRENGFKLIWLRCIVKACTENGWRINW